MVGNTDSTMRLSNVASNIEFEIPGGEDKEYTQGSDILYVCREELFSAPKNPVRRKSRVVLHFDLVSDS